MSKEKEKRKVVFRRINGRIIPVSVGVASIGAGLAVGSKKASKLYDKKLEEYGNNIAQGKNKQRLATLTTGNAEISSQNKFYNKVLTKATGDSFYGGGDGQYNPLVKRLGKYDDRPGRWVKSSDNPYPYKSNPRQGRPFAQYQRTGLTSERIRTNVKNLPLILHEAGHHQQYKAGGKSFIMDNKAIKKIDAKRFSSFMESRKIKNSGFGAPQIGSYEKDLMGKSGVIKRELIAQVSKRSKYIYHKTIDKTFGLMLKPYRFGVEMEANISAVKMANKIRGPKFAKITAKSMIPNVLGYGKKGIIGGLKYGLIGTGSFIALNGLLNRNKK